MDCPAISGIDLRARQMLAESWADGGGDVCEASKELVEGRLAVVHGNTLLVGERDAHQHSLQVVLGPKQLNLRSSLWSINVALGAGQPVLTLLKGRGHRPYPRS